MPANIILFEDSRWERFLPLVYLRGLFGLRCGTGELWQRVERVADTDAMPTEVGLWCRPQLAEFVAEETARTVNGAATGGQLLLNGRGFWSLLPEVKAGDSPWVGTAGQNDDIACIWLDDEAASGLTSETMLNDDSLAVAIRDMPRRDVSHLVTLFDWPWELVHFNPIAIEADWRLARLKGTSTPIPGSFLLNPGEIHIGAGSQINPCVVIDAEEGPVWIGANVTVRPHAYIQGPCYIGNDSLIQPGAIIREGCSFGTRCKVGGEVEASIIHGFSNKQHHGFLGHAYLGQWINMGAGSLNSDLKNTYGMIRMPINGREVETHEQIVGSLIGDFSKVGINVAFSTGAVVGLCANVMTASPPKFISSFTWLTGDGPEDFDVERALTSAVRMMARRNRELTPALEQILRRACEDAAQIEEQD